MRGGATFLVSVALLTNTACGGEGKLKIRPMPTPLAAGERTVPFRVAEARGHFALGNIGLALESFRKAAREDPASVDALAGIAACYDRMGRFDLSRRNYEAALALAPGDPQLLGQLAASLQLQGRAAEAAAVRGEMAMRLAAARPVQTAPAPQAPKAAEAPMPVATARSIVAAAPTDTPPAVARSVTVALPPPRPAVETVPTKVAVKPTPPSAPAAPDPSPPKALTESRMQPAVVPTPQAPAPVVATPLPRPVKAAPGPAPVEMVAEAKPKPVARAAPVAEPPVGRSVTIALPPPRPVQPQPVRVARAEPVAMPARRGPRIERLSPGEVALITSGGPKWRAQIASGMGPRFVPLRQASAAAAPVRLLNAARVEKLAARTRSYLVDQGWRRMTIGDAALTRSRSLIVYPDGKRAAAAKLSAEFGFDMAHRPGVRQVTILLGRDAAGLPALRARG